VFVDLFEPRPLGERRARPIQDINDATRPVFLKSTGTFVVGDFLMFPIWEEAAGFSRG
jgi:hypothetical protein